MEKLIILWIVNKSTTWTAPPSFQPFPSMDVMDGTSMATCKNNAILYNYDVTE